MCVYRLCSIGICNWDELRRMNYLELLNTVASETYYL